jgi:hypothetical protein
VGRHVRGADRFVVKFGRDVPYWDDWHLVPFVTREAPVTLDWLWHSHNGHRIAVPKLALVALLRLCDRFPAQGCSRTPSRWPSSPGVMIVATRRLRGGRTSVADAIFPLLLMHWGHYENLLWTWQVTQVVPVVIVALLLLRALRVCGTGGPPCAPVTITGIACDRHADASAVRHPGTRLRAADGAVADRRRVEIAPAQRQGDRVDERHRDARDLRALLSTVPSTHRAAEFSRRPVESLRTTVRFIGSGAGPGSSSGGGRSSRRSRIALLPDRHRGATVDVGAAARVSCFRHPAFPRRRARARRQRRPRAARPRIHAGAISYSQHPSSV